MGKGGRARVNAGLHGFPGRLYWMPGKPEVSDGVVREDALGVLAPATSPPFRPHKDHIPVVRELPGAEELVAQFHRGFMACYAKPIGDVERTRTELEQERTAEYLKDSDR